MKYERLSHVKDIKQRIEKKIVVKIISIQGSTLAFFFLLFDFDVTIKDDELMPLVFDDVTDDALAVVPDGNEGGAPPVGVVGVLGGVGVVLLLVDVDAVDIKGRLILEALFSRSNGITADSSSLLSMSFFTNRAKSTIWWWKGKALYTTVMSQNRQS